MKKIPSSEITPEHVYLSRRKFLAALGLGAANAALLAACGRTTSTPTPSPTPSLTEEAGPAPTAVSLPTPGATEDELGNELTEYEAMVNYVNYYDFSTNKRRAAELAEDFETRPWTLQVGGLVNKPRILDFDALLAYEQEERIYRMRCVEAYSMVVPWVGFPLRRLLEDVEPQSNAKFVRFQSLLDPDRMPGQNTAYFPWPYVEGLSMEEATHDLTLLATGVYGRLMPAPKGGPVRLVVPWKYGFKNIKAIVKIDLVEEMPTTFWMAAGPTEYGFWANVNPEVAHPRWSQATERRIGEAGRRETLLFNGYAEEVAHLYPNLDNEKWYY
jgi:sulfoxide reductase catalytic subunit YedY